MKISIITSVYNNEHQIAYAIESVLNQSYADIEYIIIDGASTDGTVEVVKSYGDKIDKFRAFRYIDSHRASFSFYLAEIHNLSQ